MKKTLLTLLACATMLTSSALVKAPQHLPAGRQLQSTVLSMPLSPMETPFAVTAEGPQKAAGTMDYTLAGEPYSVTQFNNVAVGNQVAMAFEITPEVATMFAGNQITKVNFYTGINAQTNTNNITLYSAFVSKDLGSTLEMLSNNGGKASSNYLTPSSITLTTPVTIEANTRYYVGVFCSLKSASDYTIVFDYMNYPSGQDQGGWVGVRANSSSTWSWQNITADLGYVCVGCTVTGDNLPTDMGYVTGVEADMTANADTPFELYFELTNKGSNEISSVEYTYQVGDQTPVTETYTLANAIDYGKTVGISTNAVCHTASVDETPVTVTINKVNGVANNAPAANATRSTNILILPAGKGYPRNGVVEEGTSIHCTWCPYGIIAFERLKNKYTDGSLGLVAVHTRFNSADPMTAATYQSFINDYISSFPTCYLNRKFYIELGISTADNIISTYFDYLKSQLSPVGVEMTCEWQNGELVYNVSEEFAFDYPEGSPYILSFAITEDNVGPYNQINGLSGNASAPDGWGEKPSPASTIFNDVARKLDTYAGIAGSVPSVIESGKKYEYVHKMTMPAAISDKANVNALCYVLDTRNGEIVTAATVKSTDITGLDSAIEEVITDTEAPVEYYNLQGIRVDNPRGGIFVRRQGNNVTKVVR